MRNRLTPWVFAAALAAIPILAFVQYRWIDRVSEAELQRESARLRKGLEQIASGLDAEIARAHLWFALRPEEMSPDGGPPTAKSVADAFAVRLARWRSGAEFAGLVREVRFSLDEETRVVRPDGSIASTDPLPDPRRLGGSSSRRTGPLFVTDSGDVGLMMPVLRAGAGPPGLEGPPGMRPPGPGRGIGVRRPPDLGPPRGGEGEGPPAGGPPQRRGQRFLVLDRDYAVKTLLPALADRFLGAGAYRLRVAEGDRLLSGPESLPDSASVRAFSMRADCLLSPDELDPQGVRGETGETGQRNELLRQAGQTCPPIPSSAPTGLWQLSASTVLGESVAGFRTRNLAISFGVLLCLAAAIAALWVSSSRAAELAQRQMEFAMSVSHELRTPLTVMRLAGDNLAQGVASSPDQIRRYGESIRRESERLAAMVEQVLTFARAQRPDFMVRAQAIPPAQIVDCALSAADALVKEAGFTVVREVEPDLPMVRADLNLTTAALTNLIVNAVRHAASGKWVRVRGTCTNGKVELEVADHGPGIARRDLRRIFRPFYRGSQSGTTQGTGLGLHLVRRIAEAHGGNVTVESSPGAGTVVTMSLPVAERASEEAQF